MLTAAERRARLDKLKKDREAREIERIKEIDDAKAKASKQRTTDELIDNILKNTRQQNEDLEAERAGMTPDQIAAEKQESSNRKSNLQFCPFVIDMEIRGKPKPLTYEKGIDCQLIDAKQAQRLDKIREDEEDWEEDFNERFEAASRSMAQDRVVQRRSSYGGSMSYKDREAAKKQNQKEK